jgi:hypothetical protein
MVGQLASGTRRATGLYLPLSPMVHFQTAQKHLS